MPHGGVGKNRLRAKLALQKARHDLKAVLNRWETAYSKESVYRGIRILLELQRVVKSANAMRKSLLVIVLLSAATAVAQSDLCWRDPYPWVPGEWVGSGQWSKPGIGFKWCQGPRWRCGARRTSTTMLGKVRFMRPGCLRLHLSGSSSVIRPELRESSKVHRRHARAFRA